MPASLSWSERPAGARCSAAADPSVAWSVSQPCSGFHLALLAAGGCSHLRCGWVRSPSASVSRRTAVFTSSNCSALVADLVSLEASVISRSPGW